MALELECRITRKLPVQEGSSARGPWKKQEFLVEYSDGKYPTTVCMNVWGADKVADLERYNVGDAVKVSITLSSREYNGRYYNDIRAWRIEPAGQQQAAAAPAAYAPQQPRAAYQPDAPAGFGPRGSYGAAAPQAPAPTIEDMPSDANDDLPF